MQGLRLGASGVLAACSGVHAQTGGWMIEVDGVATPQSPAVTVNVYAWFEPGPAVAFAGGALDLEAGEAGWTGFGCPYTTHTEPCGTAAAINGASIAGLSLGQPWLPGVLPPPNFDNPMLAIVAEWEATDFTPREVLVETTHLTDFLVYDEQQIILPVDPIVPGRALIRVVPAPGGAAPLALLALGMGARRGRR